MKKFTTILLLFAAVSYSQDYRIVSKQYAYATKKPKCEFSFTYPEIKNFTGNVTAMNMFNKHINNIVMASSDSFNVWMRDWDTISTNLEMGSYYEAGDSVFYASNKLISIQFYEGYYFSGAAHPNNSSFTVNYDLENLKELTLSDLLTAGWLSKVSEFCIKELMKQLYPDRTDVDDWVKEGAGPDEKNYKVFNVNKDGIVITFTTYQVAAYVNGPSEVFIPYTRIKDIIKEKGQLNSIK
jgi:hypothetical protein